MERAHIHLPITKDNGDLLLFADVILIDPTTGAQASPAVYDGPQEMATVLTWPVTFAPANVDLWIETPGRYDLRVIGPDGYSATVTGVDFAPAVPNQVVQPTGGVKVTNTPLPRTWLQGDSSSQARFKDPGLIAPHNHDGAAADSTRLGAVPDPRVYADPAVTALGLGASTGTAVGHLAVGDTNGTVVGSDSDAGVDGTTIGDQHASMPDGQTTLTKDAGGSETGYVKPNVVEVRGIETKAAADKIGVATLPATPAGVTHPVWIAGAAQADGLNAKNDANIGDAAGTVGFYESDGDVQGPHITGTTGVLADLITALEGYGLLADS